MRRWLRKLGAVVRKRALDEELRAEIDAHVEMLTADNIAAGMEPGQARRRARLAVGNPAVAQELHRDARGLPRLESVLQDVRYAFRTLLHDWGFTTVAVCILGLGIGANTLVFAFVDALLLQPLPFVQPERLVWISNGPEGATDPSLLASRVLTYREWAEHSAELDELAAYSPFFTRDNWALTGDGREPERLKGVRITANFLPLLGVPMHLGRTFSEAEVSTGGPPAVILDHTLWQRRFGADPAILGNAVELNDTPYTIVGVTGAGFDFGSIFSPGYDVELLLPADLVDMETWGNTLSVIGRLADGATVEAAGQEIAAFTERLRAERAELEGWAVFGRVHALHGHVNGPVRGALWLLWGAVLLVLLIVCANLANLMLVRGVSRRRELAVRAALGAGQGRLVRQLLTESLVLGLMGVAVGLALASLGLRAIVAGQTVVLPLVEQARIDGRVVAVAGLIALIVAAAVGMVPALQVSRKRSLAGLGQSSRGGSSERHENWARATLVVAEISLACTLLIGAGLLVRSFAETVDVELGFDPADRAIFGLTSGARHADSDAISAFQEQVVEALGAISNVRSVGLSDNLPFDGNRSWGVRRTDAEPDAEWTTAFVRLVSPDYFRTMGIPLVGGRTFSGDDVRDNERAVIVNRTTARTLWGDGDPLGDTVWLAGGEARVVGIVGDVRHNGMHEEAGSEIYLSLGQYRARSVSVVIHADGDPLARAGQVRTTLHELDPRIPFTDYRPLAVLIDRELSSRRFFMTMAAGFATMALVLAALGIYGVISYSVGRRRPEIGVRLALGARPRRVLVEEISRGLLLTATGLAIGLGGALVAGRLLTSQLYRVEAADPVTFALTATVLLAVGSLAAYLPARRAARTSPVAALRES